MSDKTETIEVKKVCGLCAKRVGFTCQYCDIGIIGIKKFRPACYKFVLDEKFEVE